MNYYFGPTLDELSRYSYPSWRELLVFVPYDNIWDTLRVLRSVKKGDKCFFNGFRYPDRILVQYLSGILGVSVYVLQHGANESFKLSEKSFWHSVKKIWNQKAKYGRWFLLCGLVKLMLRYAEPRADINILWWSELYRKEWLLWCQRNAIPIQFEHFARPSPLLWGAGFRVSDYRARALLVDQPYELDFSISSQELESFIISKLDERDISHVLVIRHPRSTHTFCSGRFHYVDLCPTECEVLLGLNSSLLDHDFRELEFISLNQICGISCSRDKSKIDYDSTLEYEAYISQLCLL